MNKEKDNINYDYIKIRGIYIIVSFISLIGVYLLSFSFQLQIGVWIWGYFFLLVLVVVSVILCEIEDERDKQIKVQYTRSSEEK